MLRALLFGIIAGSYAGRVRVIHRVNDDVGAQDTDVQGSGLWASSASQKTSLGNGIELQTEARGSSTLLKLQLHAKAALSEFFRVRDFEECTARMLDLLKEYPGEADEFGVIALRMAVERDAGGQDLVIRLLGKLRESPAYFDDATVTRSLEKIICSWEDIVLDVPSTPHVLLQIIKGCVDSGIVPRSWLTKLPESLLKEGLKGLTSGANDFSDIARHLKTFKDVIELALQQYFAHLNFQVVDHALAELGMPSFHHELVKKVAVMSFSKTDEDAARGDALSLLAHLTQTGAVTKDDLQWAVTRLLSQLEDLRLDAPRAPALTAELLADLVREELLGVSFLRWCRALRIGGHDGMGAIEASIRQTPEYSRRGSSAESFRNELRLMILEYFDSGNEMEFGRCVSELAPLTQAQSAEIVRKVLVQAMQRTDNSNERAMTLLSWLCRHEELDRDSVEGGFDDILARMTDIRLDIPDADERILPLVAEAKQQRLLSLDWAPMR